MFFSVRRWYGACIELVPNEKYIHIYLFWWARVNVIPNDDHFWHSLCPSAWTRRTVNEKYEMRCCRSFVLMGETGTTYRRSRENIIFGYNRIGTSVRCVLAGRGAHKQNNPVSSIEGERKKERERVAEGSWGPWHSAFGQASIKQIRSINNCKSCLEHLAECNTNNKYWTDWN